MKCPYCGDEMALGYIQCRDSITWVTKKRKVAALPSLRSDSIVIGTEYRPFSGTSVVAYNCSSCKKIVIDYSQE